MTQGLPAAVTAAGSPCFDGEFSGSALLPDYLPAGL